MCKLKAADFYYGAFLSALLNTPGGRPSLFDETDSRRIYCLETNNNDACYFFTKYIQERKNKQEKEEKKDKKVKNDSVHHWVFQFTDAEIEKLQELYEEKGRVKVVLIGVKKGFANSELAIIDFEDAMDCLGVGIGVKSYRIDIKALPNKHGLRMYGSGRSDKLNGKENTLKVDRNTLAGL